MSACSYADAQGRRLRVPKIGATFGLQCSDAEISKQEFGHGLGTLFGCVVAFFHVAERGGNIKLEMQKTKSR